MADTRGQLRGDRWSLAPPKTHNGRVGCQRNGHLSLPGQPGVVRIGQHQVAWKRTLVNCIVRRSIPRARPPPRRFRSPHYSLLAPETGFVSTSTAVRGSKAGSISRCNSRRRRDPLGRAPTRRVAAGPARRYRLGGPAAPRARPIGRSVNVKPAFMSCRSPVVRHLSGLPGMFDQRSPATDTSARCCRGRTSSTALRFGSRLLRSSRQVAISRGPKVRNGSSD